MFYKKAYLDIVEENKALKELNYRLAEEISAKNTDCRVGVWCKTCKYLRQEKALHEECFSDTLFGEWVTQNTVDEVWYCGKHLTELCPEHSIHEVPQEDNRME